MKQDQRTENGKQSSMFFHDEKVKGEGGEGKILGVLVYVPRAVRTRSSMKNAFTAFTLHPFVVLSTVLIIDLLNSTATTYLIIKQWFTKKVAECYLLADISSVVFVAFDVFKYIASHRGNSVIAGLQYAGFILEFYHTHGWFLIIAFHIAECLLFCYLLYSHLITTLN